MSLGNISRSDVQTLLNLGYYLRGVNWTETHKHLRKGEQPDELEVYIGNLRMESFGHLELLQGTNTWEIYQIGTLDIKSAYGFLKLGYNISRTGWISDKQDTLVTVSNTCSRFLQVSDVEGCDWFVPIDAKCQSLGFGHNKITSQVVELFTESMYLKYNVNLNTDVVSVDTSPTLSQQIKSNPTNFTVSTKDYPGITEIGNLANTVESILTDNEKHILHLETGVICCTVINRLLKRMKRDNISIEDLDKRLGNDDRSVVEILSRPRNINVHDLILIGNAIGYNTAELFK